MSEDRLAISIGAGAAGRSLSKVTALLGSTGWMVSGTTVREWRFDGFYEENGSLYLYGPPLAGRTLQSILDLGLAKGLPYVALLVDCLAVLLDGGVKPFPLQTDAVYFTEEGAVLFFPPDVFRELRALRPFETLRDTFEALNHPDLRGEPAACFSVAVLLYRLSTGRYPYGGASAEEIHEETRKREVVRPDRFVPELTPDFSDHVMEGLSGKHGGENTLGGLRSRLAAWRNAPPLREIPAEEKERILQAAASEGEKSGRRFSRRVFWRKNGKMVAIFAAIAVLAGFGVGSIFKGVFAPRPTHGYSPRKVVETFYLSMNGLDHSMMSSCVIGKAGQEEINEATNLFVMSRVSMGYTGKSSVVSAEEWDKAGRPALDPTRSVYGVTGLAIGQERGEPQPVFLVGYEKWIPRPGDSDSKSPSPPAASVGIDGRKVTDRVSLTKDKGDWVIDKIDRLRSEPIPVK